MIVKSKSHRKPRHPFLVSLLPSTLLISSDRVHNRPFIRVPTRCKIEANTKNHRCPKDQTRPVHRDWCRVHRGWEETEEHGDRSIGQSENVDDRANDWTHSPRSPVNIVLDRVIAKALVKEEGNGYHVRCEECSNIHTHDCVKSCRAANVDESKKE